MLQPYLLVHIGRHICERVFPPLLVLRVALCVSFTNSLFRIPVLLSVIILLIIYFFALLFVVGALR
jgi:hypothetical protein